MRFTPGFHGRSRLDADSARVPPGQYVTNDFPVLSAGPTPDTRLADWTFTVRGALDPSISWAVALARALFRKGADFTAAMAFEIASTNLVIELGIIMAVLLGWEFVLGEFVGGPLMIVLVALLFRVYLKRRLVDEARVEADKGRLGSM